MRSRSLAILAYIAIILPSLVHGAFVPMHSASSSMKEKTSTLHLFGNEPNEAQPMKEENKSFNFLLYGKRHFDWVTGQAMDENNWMCKKRVDSETSYTKSKKSQDENTKKKG